MATLAPNVDWQYRAAQGPDAEDPGVLRWARESPVRQFRARHAPRSTRHSNARDSDSMQPFNLNLCTSGDGYAREQRWHGHEQNTARPRLARVLCHVASHHGRTPTMCRGGNVQQSDQNAVKDTHNERGALLLVGSRQINHGVQDLDAGIRVYVNGVVLRSSAKRMLSEHSRICCS